jgi:glutamate-1-semialdehyde 2,1-aminomutase
MSNCGVIMPRPGYLEGVRRIASQNGAMLIFDETITGLRVALGGAQELFGVTPDITCGFKALGGGIPIFAYGASAALMEPVAKRQAVHAGTFNGNTIGCRAAKTVLTELKRDGGAAVKKINAIGRHMMEEIGKSARKHGETVRIQGTGSLFCVSFHDHEIFDMRDAFDISNDRYMIFRQLLLDRGVHIFPTEKGLWYISTAHSEKDVDVTLKTVDEVFALMRGM